MNIKPLFIEENKIFLSSYLDETAFGRTDMGRIINEAGVFAALSLKSSTGPQILELKPWLFEGTKTFFEKQEASTENPQASTDSPDSEAVKNTVFYEGELPEAEQFQTLAELFETNPDDKEKTLSRQKSILCILKTLDEVIEKLPETVIPGAEGILISQIKDEVVKVILLPGSLFDRCAENSKSYGEIQGKFNHKGLSGIERSIFTRGVIYYRAITGVYPFNEIQLEKRQADFTDENFIPVEYEVNGVSKELCTAINESLCVKAKKAVIPGEKRFVNEKQEKLRLEGIEEGKKLNVRMAEEFYSTEQEKRQGKLTDEEFLSKRKSFIKRQQKIIGITRFVNRNSRRIWVTAAIILVAAYAGNSFHKENRKLGTSKGLTAIETMETLYTGIHKADVPLLQEIAKGKKSKNLIEVTAGFYTTNKQRIAMDEKDGTLSPAQWLFFKGKTDFWQYGITDFRIDGESASSAFDYPRRMDKPAPLAQENGVELKKGNTVKHTATYNLVNYDGDAIISVIKTSDDVTLTWNGTRWVVTDIKGSSKKSAYKVKEYKAAYQDAITQTEGNVRQAAALLREKYSFVPREDELKAAVPYMVEHFNNSAAKEF